MGSFLKRIANFFSGKSENTNEQIAIGKETNENRIGFSFRDELYSNKRNEITRQIAEWHELVEQSNLYPEHKKIAHYLGPNWYPSSHPCHCCENLVFKTVFPVGKEFPIITNKKEPMRIKRAFTCVFCQFIFAPLPGYRYTDLNYEIFQALDEKEYLQRILIMGVNGTTEGRPDL